MTVVYQITDPHVPVAANDPVQLNYLRLMQFIASNPADLLVITGDLPPVGKDGDPEVYRWIKANIPLDQKTIVLPGNHDDATVMYTEFGAEHCHNREFCFTIPLVDVDLVFSNTCSGQYPQDQLAYLQQPHIRDNSILFTHYPTRKISDGYMDRTYPLGNASDADRVICKSRVEHVFCGHFHTQHQVRVQGPDTGGYFLNVTPSPAFGVELNEAKPVVTPPRIPLRKIEIIGTDVRSEVIYLDQQ